MPRISINRTGPVSWKQGSDNAFVLPPDTIDIWQIDIPSSFEELTELLVPAEREKMDRLRKEAMRRQFAVSKGGVRFLTGRYLQTSPGALVPADTQKPSWQYPNGDGLFFNTAHAAETVLIAFSNREVGIDIEKVSVPFDYHDMLHRCFHANEISMIQNAADPLALFYLLWTRKEALLKATAKGIHDEFPQVPSTDGTYEVNSNIIGSGDNWQVSSFACKEKYIASIAFHTGDIQIRFWNLSTG